MSIRVRPRAQLSTGEIAELQSAMTRFYRNPPATYYQISNEVAANYNEREHPFHCDLISRVVSGASVLEAGCGTAHLCPYVEERDGRYTGLDYGEALLQDNRKRFPKARFFPIGTRLEETFDIVASLYTVEHVVDPPEYLELLWKYCVPGGLIAIICPEFIDSPGFAPSIFFGRTPRRLGEKIRRMNWSDAGFHLIDLKFRAPAWKQRARTASAGAFWINTQPGVLHGGEYRIDTDAVHLVRLRDLVWFFRQKGAAVLQTSAEMPHVSPDVLKYNGYLLAQKPHQ